jgi:hypothetical protein
VHLQRHVDQVADLQGRWRETGPRTSTRQRQRAGKRPTQAHSLTGSAAAGWHSSRRAPAGRAPACVLRSATCASMSSTMGLSRASCRSWPNRPAAAST